MPFLYLRVVSAVAQSALHLHTCFENSTSCGPTVLNHLTNVPAMCTTGGGLDARDSKKAKDGEGQPLSF